MGLYGKPMAKNSQLWTGDDHLLLDGPKAGREELERAAEVVARAVLSVIVFNFQRCVSG